MDAEYIRSVMVRQLRVSNDQWEISHLDSQAEKGTQNG